MIENNILRPITGNPGLYAYYCIACRTGHLVWTEIPNKKGHLWTFNGNKEKPTFKPSIVVQHNNPKIICHSFITDGKIEYLSDCNHSYAGKTVDMIPF